MADPGSTSDISVSIEGNVATVTVHRPPNNYFDRELVETLAATYERLESDGVSRAIVLRTSGKNFSAGVDLRGRGKRADLAGLYAAAERLFRVDIPVVAAVQGAAVGGGVGLACSADFRVANPSSYFAANFSRLGLHHGFGLTVSLPRILGPGRAAELLLTGRRVGGDEAAAIGLCDRLVPIEELDHAATTLARELAAAAPLAVRSIRTTLRSGFPEAVSDALRHELSEQASLGMTADCAEGVRAAAERRAPIFVGR